ncbi:MAG: SAM-dependent DNA methyltransferase [Negativicutes bacterium]|nr:SAM-dependent DNA methyltransferase [Negativicutes bacterium]
MNGNILANRDAVDRDKTDFYRTPAEVTVALLNYLNLPSYTVIWEPACGEGHMSEAIKEFGYPVISSELYDRGYGLAGKDFLSVPTPSTAKWIITNPPFGRSVEFIDRCLDSGLPFALLFKSQYWHAEKRQKLFYKRRPSSILALNWRPDFLFGEKGGSPTMEVIWTVWDAEPSMLTDYLVVNKPILKKDK